MRENSNEYKDLKMKLESDIQTQVGVVLSISYFDHPGYLVTD